MGDNEVHCPLRARVWQSRRESPLVVRTLASPRTTFRKLPNSVGGSTTRTRDCAQRPWLHVHTRYKRLNATMKVTRWAVGVAVQQFQNCHPEIRPDYSYLLHVIGPDEPTLVLGPGWSTAGGPSRKQLLAEASR